MILTLQSKTPSIKLKTTTKQKESTSEFRRIRCPHCKWQPKKYHLWMCSNCDAPEFFHNGCGTVWHTFDTKGRCPGCHYQWKYTKCFSCNQWSRHEDWYVNKDEPN